MWDGVDGGGGAEWGLGCGRWRRWKELEECLRCGCWCWWEWWWREVDHVGDDGWLLGWGLGWQMECLGDYWQ